MRIAVIGTRGIPARYDGFKACAQELSVGLVKRGASRDGHKVTVYCHSYLYPRKIKK